LGLSAMLFASPFAVSMIVFAVSTESAMTAVPSNSA